MEVKLRAKGRITIPAHIRRDLGIGEGEKLEVIGRDGAIILKPKNLVPADKIKGIIGPAKVEIEEVEEALGRDPS